MQKVEDLAVLNEALNKYAGNVEHSGDLVAFLIGSHWPQALKFCIVK